jgi:hypothetical protein
MSNIVDETNKWLEDQKRLNELHLDFVIDKTYKTYFEAGNNLGKAFLSYLLLMCLAGMLVFGQGVSDSVKIPFLDLTVNKSYAALIVLVISCGSLYWFMSTLMLHQMLGQKLAWMLHERYGTFTISLWKIAYPSTYSAFIHANSADLSFITGAILIGFTILFPLVSSILPVVIAWFIGKSFQLPLTFRVTLCIAILLLEIPSMYTLWLTFPKNRKALIKSIEEDERKDIEVKTADEMQKDAKQGRKSST